MRFLYFLVVPVFFVLIGCVPGTNWKDSTSIKQEIKVTHDDLKKQTKYVGPEYRLDNLGHILLLRSWKDDDSQEVIFQFYASMRYGGSIWRMYERTFDIDDNQLETISISKKFNCEKSVCTYYENVGIKVDRKYLEDHTESGVKFKIESNAGADIIEIPGPYITAFLIRVGEK